MKNNILRYGIMKKLGRGIRMSCFLTFRCTLDCYYCTLRAGGGYPTSEEMSLHEWIKIIKRFPEKIREIVISGGEPMLHKDFVPFVQFLLDRGYYVTVYTNLSLKKGLELKPSRRLRFEASLHSSVRGNKPFYLKEYQEKFRVDVNDINSAKRFNRTFYSSKFRFGESEKGMLRCYDCQGTNKYPDEGVCYCNRITICPDGKVATNQMDMIRMYTK